MRFPKKTDAQFHEIFTSIITANKNNTYKLALALFLLEHSKCKPRSYKVQYEEIAKFFLRYYWSHVCKSKLRQGPANQVPLVVKIIRGEFKKDVYPMDFSDLEEAEPRRVEKCIGMITKRCFKDVVPRFHKIDGRNQCVFYKYWSKKYRDKSCNERPILRKGILINPAAAKFLRKNCVPLYKSVILEWVKFLETKNFGAPNLAKKVEAKVRGPKDQRKFLPLLKPFSKKCFYCRVGLNFDSATHVDHVIPYDYMGETELWNAVLACQRCNCTKLDRLPPERFVKALITQNRRCYPKMGDLRKSIDSMHGGRHTARISKSAAESLRKNIYWHYRSAADSGYPPLRAFPPRSA